MEFRPCISGSHGKGKALNRRYTFFVGGYKVSAQLGATCPLNKELKFVLHLKILLPEVSF